MFEKDGIAYAGNQTPPLKVWGVRPLDNFMLWLRFNTGESRLLDCKPLFDFPAFAPLKDQEVFKSVYIDYGVPVWNDGEIDLSPEYAYENSVPASAAAFSTPLKFEQEGLSSL